MKLLSGAILLVGAEQAFAHAQLVQFASVRFISENVDMNTWIRLAIRDDGLPLGEF